MTWTYEVSNPGNIALSDVAITDDNGTALDTTDDFVATLVSGDTNSDGLLDLDETWTFEATGTAISGQYQNDATATGTPLDVTNPDGTTSPATPVDATDDDRYFGAGPALSVVKAVNGDDANEAPGILVPIGDEVSWAYTVTNTGTTPLIDINLSDDQGVVVTCPATTLDIGETMVCTGAAEAATAGQYTNIGTASGTPAEPTGSPGVFTAITDPATGGPVGPVTADDAANHFGTGPAIEIQKTVCILDDATSCDIDNEDHWGESTVIANGDDVVWRIQVINIGNIDLTNVVVTDLLAPACEQTRTLVETGETWSYTCADSGTTEPTLNTASVDATPDADGFLPVTSSDTAETIDPPELELIKSVDQTEFMVGTTATYEVEVTNTGELDATNIEILDTLPNGLTSISLLDGDQASYDAADHTITWSIAALAIGETVSISYTAEVSSAGDLVNDVAIISDHEENDLANNSDSVLITASPIPEPDPPAPESAPPLAFTGANSGAIVVWGVFLLALGLLLVVLARRRILNTRA